MKSIVLAFLFAALLLAPIRAQQFTGTNLFAQTASVTVANTTTETTVIGAGVGSLVLPANFFYSGRQIAIVVRGYCSTQTLAPGTLAVRVKLGSTTLGTANFTSLVGALGNQMFAINYSLTCRTTGASGTIMGQGETRFEGLALNLTTAGMVSTSAVTIDTTTSQTLNLTLQWGVASAQNSITVTNCLVQSWN